MKENEATREKIIELLKMVDKYHYVLDSDIEIFADEFDQLISAEVEKQITEICDQREIEKHRTLVLQGFLMGDLSLYDVAINIENWFRNRLTKDSQKTEGNEG